MKGCMAYRQAHLEQFGYRPFIVANTLPAFAHFLLRTVFLNCEESPNLPEGKSLANVWQKPGHFTAGFGGTKQSAKACKYIRYVERMEGRKMQHVWSPQGEKKVRVGDHLYSIDCYDAQ